MKMRGVFIMAHEKIEKPIQSMSELEKYSQISTYVKGWGGETFWRMKVPIRKTANVNYTWETSGNPKSIFTDKDVKDSINNTLNMRNRGFETEVRAYSYDNKMQGKKTTTCKTTARKPVRKTVRR